MSDARWMGRYRLDELVGRGAMGEVWRAYDKVLGREVAVKLLPPDLDDSPVEQERLLREAHAAAQVEHPNVVAVHDVGRSSGRPYLVMELLEGRTLGAELAESGPLPIDRVRDAWEQARAGLHAAHRVGVVHRDIKPGNLLRTADGTIKIVDFGLADNGWGGRLTRSGTFVGTAGYAAPERILGHLLDGRSDLYSLGCVLYELLTGRWPFEGDVLAQTYAHVHTRPEPPSRLRPDIPADLEQLVLALLHKEPERRPSAVDGATPVPAAGTPARAGAARGSRAAVVGGLAVLGIAAATIVVAWAPQVGNPPPADTDAEISGPVSTPDDGDGSISLLPTSPSDHETLFRQHGRRDGATPTGSSLTPFRSMSSSPRTTVEGSVPSASAERSEPAPEGKGPRERNHKANERSPRKPTEPGERSDRASRGDTGHTERRDAAGEMANTKFDPPSRGRGRP